MKRQNKKGKYESVRLARLYSKPFKNIFNKHHCTQRYVKNSYIIVITTCNNECFISDKMTRQKTVTAKCIQSFIFIALNDLNVSIF